MEKQGFPLESFLRDTLVHKCLLLLRELINNRTSLLQSSTAIRGHADFHHLRFLTFCSQEIFVHSDSSSGTRFLLMCPGGRCHQQCLDLHVCDLTTEFHCPEDLVLLKAKGYENQYNKFTVSSRPRG